MHDFYLSVFIALFWSRHYRHYRALPHGGNAWLSVNYLILLAFSASITGITGITGGLGLGVESIGFRSHVPIMARNADFISVTPA